MSKGKGEAEQEMEKPGRSGARQETASLRQCEDQPFHCKFKMLSYSPKQYRCLFKILIILLAKPSFNEIQTTY